MIAIKKMRTQSGFTLVELMVGLVIGLLATLVIMQSFSSFEGNKRSTTGISDAQTSGSLGLYMLQRELQFAGYGLPAISGTMPEMAILADQRAFVDFTGMTQAELDTYAADAKTAYEAKLAEDVAAVRDNGEVYTALKCNPVPLMNIDADNDPITPDVPVDIITPVRVVDNYLGTGNDRIEIHYNTTSRGAIATAISGVGGANYLAVQNNLGCRENDIVLVTHDSDTDTSCAVSRVTSKNPLPSITNLEQKNQLSQTSGGALSPIALYVTSNVGMDVGDRLACLGQHIVTTFDVANRELRKNDQPIMTEIVSLQAQYGFSDVGNSEIVDDANWVDATGAVWTTPTVINRNRIKAVRIALIARNNLLERNAVSQDCNGGAAGLAEVCLWNDTPQESGANLAAILGADWNRYRYRVYEVVVPLRNVLAASSKG
jgi:type IV pilus assembly protein PilW